MMTTATQVNMPGISIAKANNLKRRYRQWLAKPSYDQDRDAILDMLRARAAEYGVDLNEPEQQLPENPETKRQLFEPAHNEMYLMKVHFDGSQMIAVRQGDNKGTNAKKHDRTCWDDLFDDMYAQLKAEEMKNSELVDVMTSRFATWYEYDGEEPLQAFVSRKLHNKTAASHMRTLRYQRKRDNNVWNYFLTFTYDDAIIESEEVFVKKLFKKFNNLAVRKGWRIIGRLERGEENNRLHFHGVAYIPEGSIPGELGPAKAWNGKEHAWHHYIECSDFRKKFGMNEWEKLENRDAVIRSANYVFKYVTKENDHIFYSRGIKSDQIMLLSSSTLQVGCVITMRRKIKKYVVFNDAIKRENGVYTVVELPLLPPPPTPPRTLFDLMR